jgi:hypothetical protein
MGRYRMGAVLKLAALLVLLALCASSLRAQTAYSPTDACQRGPKHFQNINQTANTQLVAGVANQNIYICGIWIAPVATATNIAFVEGTGSTCGTGTVALPTMGGGGSGTAATGPNLAVNEGYVTGNGGWSIGMTATVADSVCLFQSAANQISGVIIMGAAAMRLAVLLIPLSLSAQIALDNTLDVGHSVGTSLSNSFIISGTNRALVVAARNSGVSTSYITGVTALKGGIATAMTEIGIELNIDGDNPTSLWYMTNPDTGSNTITLSAAGGASLDVVAHSYTGVSQTGQPEAFVLYQGTGGNAVLFNGTLTTISANAWLVFGIVNRIQSSFTVTSGNGETGQNLTIDVNGVGLLDRGPFASPGSNSLSCTFLGNGTTNDVSGVVISLAPASIVNTLHLLNLLGVGN